MKEFDFNNVPIVDIANEVLLDGVKRGASDIHFDPYKEGLIIRMRVDGVLYDYAMVPTNYKRNMVSRIKMIASMNIMETRLPQDGAIKSRIGDKDLDLRVSSLPTADGEKVVLRILDYSKSLQGLETLGFSEHNLAKIMKMIEIPNGIVLVTGATGSGKSTTVYSILQKLNTREVNIITVEDPVEMSIEGLNQVQAQSEIGLDFATVLRSILRQDPDIIMIGEIRDSETARIAVRASITGHKVLSTIHTNSALNTIERLTDMDVERYLIGTSLNGVISQKLARKLCPHCRITRETNNYEKELFKKVLHEDVDKVYEVNPDGCEHCFHGYKARTALAEVLLITDEIRTAITEAEPKDVMRKLVYINGHTHTLLEDGLEKIRDGYTNFDELFKLVDLENDLAIHEAFYDEYEKMAKEKRGEKVEKDEEVKEEKADTKEETLTEEPTPDKTEIETEEVTEQEVQEQEPQEVEETPDDTEVLNIEEEEEKEEEKVPESLDFETETLDFDEDKPEGTKLEFEELPEEEPETLDFGNEPQKTEVLDLDDDDNEKEEVLDLGNNENEQFEIVDINDDDNDNKDTTPTDTINDIETLELPNENASNNNNSIEFVDIDDEDDSDDDNSGGPAAELLPPPPSHEDNINYDGLQNVPFVDETLDL